MTKNETDEEAFLKWFKPGNLLEQSIVGYDKTAIDRIFINAVINDKIYQHNNNSEKPKN